MLQISSPNCGLVCLFWVWIDLDGWNVQFINWLCVCVFESHIKSCFLFQTHVVSLIIHRSFLFWLSRSDFKVILWMGSNICQDQLFSFILDKLLSLHHLLRLPCSHCSVVSLSLSLPPPPLPLPLPRPPKLFKINLWVSTSALFFKTVLDMFCHFHFHMNFK